jgi:hypothetical protein
MATYTAPVVITTDRMAAAGAGPKPPPKLARYRYLNSDRPWVMVYACMAALRVVFSA